MKVAGHRIIVGWSKDHEVAAKRAVSAADAKHGDCFGNWGGFGVGRLFVAVQVDHGPQRTENVA